MKILWVTDKFPPSTGGVQNYLHNCIKNLCNCSSWIICKDDNSEAAKIVDNQYAGMGIAVVRVNCMSSVANIRVVLTSFFKIINFVKIVCKVTKRNEIKFIIFGQINFFNLYSMLLLKITTKLTIATLYHGEEIPLINMRSNPIKRWLMKKADLFICNSNYTYRRLTDFCGDIQKHIIAYPGVENRFFANASCNLLQDRFRCIDRKVIITLGRLDSRKGHNLVIEALPKVVEKYPNILYLIGGTGQLLDVLKEKVAVLQLQEYVRFCGFIPDDDIVSFHQLADLFVMPNQVMDDGDTEGFGIVFLEANACGKPVIGGSCGGALDAIEDGRTGFLVDPQDADKLAEKMIYLLSHPDKSLEMGSYARMRAWQFFRWPVLVEKFEKSLDEMV